MDDEGQGIVEFALIICILAISLIVAMIFLVSGVNGGSR